MFLDFINSLPSAVVEGLIWGIMAIGVYISYKLLDIADLTVDGSFCTGAATCAVLIHAGVPAWAALIVAILAGIIAGTFTGILHTLCGIPSILAGILTQLVLYSVNLVVLGMGPLSSLCPISPDNHKLLISMRDTEVFADSVKPILVAGLIVAAVIIVLWLFFYTEVGLTLKSTGDNPDMSRAQGVNVNLNKVIGLAISNGLVALSGGLYAQYKGSADISDGKGAIVIGLAAIIIGLAISTKIKQNFVVSLIGVVGGAIIYYIIYKIVVLMGIDTNYLKMLSAIIVILFLAVPYFKKSYFTRQKKLVFEDTSPAISLDGDEEDERRA